MKRKENRRTVHHKHNKRTASVAINMGNIESGASEETTEVGPHAEPTSSSGSWSSSIRCRACAVQLPWHGYAAADISGNYDSRVGNGPRCYSVYHDRTMRDWFNIDINKWREHIAQQDVAKTVATSTQALTPTSTSGISSITSGISII